MTDKCIVDVLRCCHIKLLSYLAGHSLFLNVCNNCVLEMCKVVAITYENDF